MRRAVPAVLLGAAVLALGLFTIFVCASNRDRGVELDALVREVDHLVLSNARARARVEGHEPGVAASDADRLARGGLQ